VVKVDVDSGLPRQPVGCHFAGRKPDFFEDGLGDKFMLKVALPARYVPSVKNKFQDSHR
tara:strand:- start:442 stop:618 length:177 start_codon:yes stop_codon:yes gene_type:complete